MEDYHGPMVELIDQLIQHGVIIRRQRLDQSGGGE